LLSIGPVDVHWYGLFIVVGILAAIFVILRLAGPYSVSKDFIIDSSFYLIFGGVIGARLYHVFLEWPYYLQYPSEIVKVWHGGLAIHGAIITGAVISFFLARKNGVNPWLLLAIFAAGMPLAQAVGRWGNYFNQELFGLPTALPWGIPILPAHRPAAYFNYQYFHPAFLYESLGNLVIFCVLLFLHFRIIKGRKFSTRYYQSVLAAYLAMYSVLRFFMEFIRVDEGHIIFGLRFPQWASIFIFGAVVAGCGWLALRGRVRSGAAPQKTKPLDTK